MILAATGHRPDKLGGYGDDVLDRLRRGARRYMERRGDVSTAISGMALGWDTAWAMAAIDLGIPLIAAVPFTGQESRWPEASQVRYRELLGKAARVEIVCAGGYSASKMHKRNEWMVDHCDELVALWDGSDGGTANCVAYATFCEKPIDHLWPQWSGRPPPKQRTHPMKKTDVIRAMAEMTGLSRPDAKAALNAFATVVVEALKAGDTVQLTGFANFKPIAVRERMVSNPRTRQMMPVSARTRVNVRMAKGVKAYLDRDRQARTLRQGGEE